MRRLSTKLASQSHNENFCYALAHKVASGKATPINSVVASTFILSILSATATYAAPTVTVVPPATGATTVVEQDTNGNVTTITATPNGISMQNGMPYAVTQVQTTPSFTTIQPVAVTTTTPAIVTTPATPIAVINTPATNNTVVTPVAVAPVVATPIVTTTPSNFTVAAIQLNPTFSLPNAISENTKIVKILRDASGQEFAAPASTLQSGDVIEYHVTFANATLRPIHQVTATITLPSGIKVLSIDTPMQTLATTSTVATNATYQSIRQVGNTTLIQTSEALPLNTYTGLQFKLSNLAPKASKNAIIRAQIQ